VSNSYYPPPLQKTSTLKQFLGKEKKNRKAGSTSTRSTPSQRPQKEQKQEEEEEEEQFVYIAEVNRC
jgi:hypothetical protein